MLILGYTAVCEGPCWREQEPLDAAKRARLGDETGRFTIITNILCRCSAAGLGLAGYSKRGVDDAVSSISAVASEALFSAGVLSAVGLPVADKRPTTFAPKSIRIFSATTWPITTAVDPSTTSTAAIVPFK